MNADGFIDRITVSGGVLSVGILPAISLKSDVTVTNGNGTYDSPYLININ